MTTDGLSPLERSWAEETRSFWLHCSAYAKQHATRPQTIGYALVDSPVGLLAWILDKFAEWTDTADSPFEIIPLRPHPRRRHPLLVDTNRCLGCPHLLRESWRGNRVDPRLRIEVPAAISVNPRDSEKCPRPWAAERHRQIVRWATPVACGHFPSLEVPEAFVADLREGARGGADRPATALVTAADGPGLG